MQWLPWVLLFLGAALFWRDLWAAVKPRVLRLIADCQAAGGACKSALGGRLSMLLIGVVIGTFTPQAISWVRANGWQIPWPNIPVIVPSGDMRAVIVTETGKPLTREQQIAISSGDVIETLNSKCAKVNGRPAWRNWDIDVDTANETPEWQAMWQSVKPQVKELPALVILNGSRVSVHPVTTEAAMLDLLRKGAG